MFVSVFENMRVQLQITILRNLNALLNIAINRTVLNRVSLKLRGILNSFLIIVLETCTNPDTSLECGHNLVIF